MVVCLGQCFYMRVIFDLPPKEQWQCLRIFGVSITWSRDAKGPWKGQDTAECPAKTGPPYYKALFGPKHQQCEFEKPWSRPSGAAREDPRVSVLHRCFLLTLVLRLVEPKGRGWGPPSAPQLPLVLAEARRPPPLRRWSS